VSPAGTAQRMGQRPGGLSGTFALSSSVQFGTTDNWCGGNSCRRFAIPALFERRPSAGQGPSDRLPQSSSSLSAGEEPSLPVHQQGDRRGDVK